MDPAAAAEILRRALPDPKRPMTVADASVASGLPLRDAESGLHWLTKEFRGHLRVTEDGDLVHLFPYGFEKPWETREAMAEAARAVGRALSGIGRFVVRAWILVVMVGYALLFVALLLGLTFARQGSSDRDDGPGTAILAGLFRMIADALFWTFHPWSPFYLDVGSRSRGGRRRGVAGRGGADDVPFYEKVNRFVFGPAARAPDPHAARARVLAEVRAKKGRVGLADVMRVTGLPREEADSLMAQLMLDHDGTVEVGDQGGIVYRFEALRRTAGAHDGGRPSPAWEAPPVLAPLTGNTGLANTAIAALNGFNLLVSAWVLGQGLTLSNLALLFSREPPPVLPDDGVPLALGLVPFTFSLALFVLPLARAALRTRSKRRVAEETARLNVLREVLARAPHKEPVPDEALRQAVRVATGSEPDSRAITAQVVALGGDVDVGPEGEVRYRFADLEAEAEALEEERARAPESEARLGAVVFASDE